MAIPLLALALALSAAGTGASYIGQRKAEGARSDALAAERTRGKKYDEQAKGVNEGSRKRFEDVGGQQEAKEAELADLFIDQGEAPAFGPAPSSSNITVQREAKEKGEAKDFTDQQGRAKADLLSFGDVLGDISRGQARDATQLSGIEGARRGSQGVLPLELDAAGQEGAGWRLGGDILGGLGTLGTMGALSGASLAGLPGAGMLGLGPKPLAGTNHLAGAGGGGGLLSLFRR